MLYLELRLGGHGVVGVFREWTGLDSESNVTLRRGITSGNQLSLWRDRVVEDGAEPARVDGSIALLDRSARTVAAYGFRQGWPVKYTGPDLSAKTNEVAIEELVICHEGWTTAAP